MALQVRRNVSLKVFNTLGIEALAAELVELERIQQCAELLAYCRAKPVLIMGGGSNLVLAADFPGLVILNRLRGIRVLSQDHSSVLVEVAAGENWDDFVACALSQGWYGLENLSAIPGTVGAAPIQNIGAYGVEVGDFIFSVQVFSLDDGSLRELSAEDCQFGYRESIFKSALLDRNLITHVNLRLPLSPSLKLDYGEIRRSMQASGIEEEKLTPVQLRQLIIQIRANKLPNPTMLPNVGSFFKNPIVSMGELETLQQRWSDVVCYPVDGQRAKIAAGWLLDRLGWKGKQLGRARVHDRQALVLINESDSALDLLALKQAIQNDVFNQTGIALEMEPKLVYEK